MCLAYDVCLSTAASALTGIHTACSRFGGLVGLVNLILKLFAIRHGQNRKKKIATSVLNCLVQGSDHIPWSSSYDLMVLGLVLSRFF